MKLSVIIVSYKVKFYLEQCLLAVKKATAGIESEIYVVDNHSNDGSVEFIAERFPDINLISSNHNNGFSHANNIAIRQCSGEYVLLLNPDTIVGERSIKEVLKFMDAHPKAGGVGVKMLNADGSCAKESRRGVPTVATSFYKMTGLCACYPHSQRFAHYYMGHLPWDKSAQIEIISGAFCMLRHSAIDKIGLLDEDFFMYGEDVDLSYRLLKGGYENWYVPVEILHYKGESAHKSSFRYVHVFYNAMLIFFRKHYGNKAAIISLPIKAAVVVKATITLLHMKATAVHKSLGFFTRNKDTYVQYVFIGSAEAIGKCRRLCRHRGVEMEFVEGNAQTMPQGHSNMELATKQKFCVVYDVDSFSYDQIFGIFQGNCLPNTTIGTYNPTTNTIITAREVIR
ncbi:glycosyltransferase family 2 protein [uncultured Prevotella sp.]|uniref:glycosyltransferase family 2 protein n=1 Tax=uncultured Prevotella sp. TaxID=159272 RepID=UPI0027E230D0|nr:glycosyltransferase family 2 protein [uncultured Prevotella sp.]